jgi:NAD/NADP transhydrogenase beta subunit
MVLAELPALAADEREGALRPLLVALIATLAGISSGAAGLVLDNTAMIVTGLVLAGMGSVLVNLITKATNLRSTGTRKANGASHFIDGRGC